MKIERPNSKEPTPEEVQELAELQAVIDRAIADGALTHVDSENLRNIIFSHGETTAEQLYRKIELYRSIVTEKVQKGELWCESPVW